MSGFNQHKALPGRSFLMRLLYLICILGVLQAGCYSFKGFSVDPSLNSFRVAQFGITAPNAPPNINQTFSEGLKRKISRESRLVLDEVNPDIQFGGTVTRYHVSAVSPEPGEFAALQRLEITVSIEYTNFRDPEDKWTQNFSFFADYPPEQNLLDVQDDLILIIFDQIEEDIFNKAFTNW